MKFWSVARRDLKIHFTDFGAIFMSFILPVVIITIASYALSEFITGQSAGSPTVPVVVLDSSDTADRILEGLRASEGLFLEETYREGEETRVVDEAYARAMIEEGYRAAAIVIPEGFGDAVAGPGQGELVVLQNPGELVSPRLVRAVLLDLANRISALALAVDVTVAQVMEMTAGYADSRRVVREAKGRAEALWEEPAVTVRTEDIVPVQAPNFDPFKQYIPGLAVMFVLFNILGGGQSIFKDKAQGTLRRLLLAPVNKASILAGKLVPYFIVALSQLFLFFGFGHLVFGMDLGASIPGLVLLGVVLALTATSLCMLMASIATSENQLSSLSILVILVMSSLGGSWWPLEIVPDFMKTLAHVCTINAWALDGFKDLLWYGRGVRAILPECGVLLGMSVLFYGVGVMVFRFE